MKFKDISPTMVTEDRYDDRQDAEADAWDDKFGEWIMDNVVGSDEYPTVYDVLEAADVDEEPWLAIDAAFPEGSSEDWVVDGENAKAFISLAIKQPHEAIKNYAKPISALYDDDDLKDRFADGEEFSRLGPDHYFDAPR